VAKGELRSPERGDWGVVQRGRVSGGGVLVRKPKKKRMSRRENRNIEENREKRSAPGRTREHKRAVGLLDG